jgi:hypothetical protein
MGFYRIYFAARMVKVVMLPDEKLSGHPDETPSNCHFLGPETSHSVNLPQLAETNTPRRLDAVEDRSR